MYLSSYKEIYSVLDDQGRELFCQFLSALSEVHHGKDEDKTENEFQHGEQYQVDSDLVFQRSEDEIYLQQQLVGGFSIVHADHPYNSRFDYNFDEDINANPQTLFNPLDRVKLVSADGQIQVVPAIYLKLLADKAEWDEVVEATTTAIIIVSIIVSVATLGSGAPLLIQLFAVADIAIGGVDLLLKIDAIRGLLAKSEQGKWVLDNWTAISTSVGLGMLSYTLVKGIVKHGPELLAKLSKVRGRGAEQAQRMAAKIREIINSAQVELYFSAKLGRVLMGVEPLSIMFNLLRVTAKARVERLGIRLSKALDDGSGVRALIFRGEAIAEGDVKYLKNKLRELLKMRDDELKRLLEDALAKSGKRYSKAYVGKKLQPLVNAQEAYRLYGKIGKKLVQAVDAEVKTFANLSKNAKNRKVMVAGMVYRKGNKVSSFFVENNFLKKSDLGKLAKNGKYLDKTGNPSIYQSFLDEMHPILKKRYERHMEEIGKGLKASADDIARAGIPASHGEIRALDALLKEIDPLGKLGDDVFRSILGYNRILRVGKTMPTCVHCYYLTEYITFVKL